MKAFTIFGGFLDKTIFFFKITRFPKQFFFFNIKFFLLLTPGCLGTCVFGVTNCVMPKRAPVQLLHGQIKLYVSIQVTNLYKENQIQDFITNFYHTIRFSYQNLN